ncbi:MAG: mitochondrial fission ELM1 family protein, partial [Candidatus Omnitrophica bacterium]|nr:mitochondrial fission ELM1 family protein [Candidatus Omnitrophota bacterium]
MKKEILLLSDTKAGHQNQGRALIKELVTVIVTSGIDTEPGIRKIQLKFKSRFSEKLFAFLSPLIYFFTYKNIPFLNNFISEETIKDIKEIRPDIIISVGSSTIPLALLLSKIYKSKKISLMNPPFPFNLFHFDLIIVPQHDRTICGKNVLSTILALSPFDNELIQKETANLKRQLKRPERIGIGILIGGDAKKYLFNRKNMNVALDEIIKACRILDIDFIATTCRRTPVDYENELKVKLDKMDCCAFFVPANKESATNLVSGLIGLCKIMIAT